jgi:hypothetical protein
MICVVGHYASSLVDMAVQYALLLHATVEAETLPAFGSFYKANSFNAALLC